jgi:hypothetical protein
MSADFDEVRATAAQSMAGRVARRTGTAVRAAWETSFVGRSLASFHRGLVSAPFADRLRLCATTIAIAAAGHLVLTVFMPVSVAPALPAVLLVASVAALSAIVSWQAVAVERAWRHSRLSRLLRRRDG